MENPSPAPASFPEAIPSPGITRAEQNLLLLESMIPDSEPFYIWCYNLSGAFIASSCPDSLAGPLEKAFRALDGLDRAMALARDSSVRLPALIGSSVGLTWGITLERAPNRDLLFVCGPVFHALPDAPKLRSALYAGDGLGGGEWIDALCEALPQMPVLSWAVFTRYVIMTHNLLTGQQVGLEALAAPAGPSSEHPAPAVGERNRLSVYQAEQALLDMVRSGDINYQSVLHRSASLSPGVPVQGRDPLRQIKTSIIVFTTLVSRAAIEGGLSPEIAYPLGDSYIQAAENCGDSGELNALAQTMYHDFIYQVHHLKANPNFSHPIQKCCDYIELSLERKISAADLAALVGYSEYYLTEKFKRETGLSVSAWIREARVARARILLESTDLPVAEIADRLSFSTPSYFIQCFRASVGCTPAQYRRGLRPEPAS